ncbi:MAG: hypothetical protein J0M12_09350 [Deltaproteobacteria bacterium]|nr:hypothetical protein [Deltaproteobacteria bacterium]
MKHPIAVAFLFVLVAVLTFSVLLSSVAFADTGPTHRTDCGTTEKLNQADLRAAELFVEFDGLIGQTILLDDNPMGTCKQPKTTGGCLSCEDKASCQLCCTDNFGSSAPGGSEKKRAGCQKACQNKWPKGSTTECTIDY